MADPASGNAELIELFRAHGVDAVPDGEWVSLPGCGLRAYAVLFDRERTVQLDVNLEVAPGRVLCESCAGLGGDRADSVRNAFANFAVNSLHVLLAAFVTGDVADEQVNSEEWVVGGVPRRAIVGNAGIKGEPPVRGAELVAWFEPFAAAIQARSLPPGPHWVRLYYAQMDDAPLVTEVLLDNEPWDDVRGVMAAFPWPKGEAFYSVRLFLVLLDGE